MQARNSNAFASIQSNKYIRETWKNSQKINLEHYLTLKKVKKFEIIWKKG